MQETETDKPGLPPISVALFILGAALGILIGYCVYALQNQDAQDRYTRHLLEYHSGRHSGV